MALHANAPVIIKRKKVVAGGGHHGGAWKVAYADFVTAMMAFFMLMWLLNATTEQQRKGLADYFAPTVPLSRVSAGGDGMFGGQDIFTTQLLPQQGQGGLADLTNNGTEQSAEVAALRDLESILIGQGGEALFSEKALRHVVTRVTDEGLVIEIFDLPDSTLFMRNSTEMRAITREILGVIARVSAMVTNGMAIEGHVATPPIVALDTAVWQLSSGRADSVRAVLEEAGVTPERLVRVTGHADRDPANDMPTTSRNDRIEVILLRSDQR